MATGGDSAATGKRAGRAGQPIIRARSSALSARSRRAVSGAALGAIISLIIAPHVVGAIQIAAFIGAADVGQRGAILYTIVESCRRRGLDPLAYLRDVLTRLPKMLAREVPSITPEAWAKAQRAARRQAA